jgi:hypothetical protein
MQQQLGNFMIAMIANAVSFLVTDRLILAKGPSASTPTRNTLPACSAAAAHGATIARAAGQQTPGASGSFSRYIRCTR